MNEALPPNDWEIRGELAAALTCWPRLTGAEAANLVQYAAHLHARKCITAQNQLAEKEACITSLANDLETSQRFKAAWITKHDSLQKAVHALESENATAIRLGQAMERQRDELRRELKAAREDFETERTHVLDRRMQIDALKAKLDALEKQEHTCPECGCHYKGTLPFDYEVTAPGATRLVNTAQPAQSIPLPLGNYQLSSQQDGHVWIYNRRGEGGRFSADKLAQVIDALFQEHF